MEQRNIGIALESLDRLGYGEAMRHSPAPPPMVLQMPSAGNRGPSGPLISGLSVSVRDDAAVIRAIERRTRDAMDEFATRIEV